MANEDNTQQLNQGNREVLFAIRDLNGRLNTVEEIILARLNDTRPFEHQVMTRLNEFSATQAVILETMTGIGAEQTAFRAEHATMREGQAAMRKELAAMREEQSALRADFNEFREETNQNFRVVSKKMALLNEDFLSYRAEQALLEKRVEVLEERTAA